MDTICVFAGASSGENFKFTKTARKLGKLIAINNFNLVYGGAKIGLMGEIASSCLSNGGEVIGVIPKLFVNYDFEVVHNNLTDLIITKNMHERKKIMYDLASKFVVLPGGLGTLDELMEVLTWKQIGILHQDVYIINIDNYWDKLLKLINNVATNKFMDSKNLLNFTEIKNDNELTRIFDSGENK